jgi:hypothetical protein
MWKDRCSIFHQEKITDPDTHLTDFQEKPLLEDLPCKLSFETLTSNGEDHVAAVTQITKLFLSPDVDIPPGCKIVVTRFNQTERKFEFSKSGLAGVFTNHQEIYLDTFRGYA